jgi:hypothetical protein
MKTQSSGNRPKDLARAISRATSDKGIVFLCASFVGLSQSPHGECPLHSHGPVLEVYVFDLESARFPWPNTCLKFKLVYIPVDLWYLVEGFSLVLKSECYTRFRIIVINAGSAMPADSHSKPLHKALRGRRGARRCAKAAMSSPIVEKKAMRSIISHRMLHLGRESNQLGTE